jgi:hypothetical protein
MVGKDYSKAMQSKDDQGSAESAAVWWNLCGRAWTEEDPVKFLEVTMQISKFLARKQQRLDAEYDQARQIQEVEQPQRKKLVN